MTRGEIANLAIEAGLPAFIYPELIAEADWKNIEAFVKLVRNDYSNKHAKLWLKRIDEAVKAEREACAKLCEEHPEGLNMLGGAFVMCASAIRSRSQQ